MPPLAREAHGGRDDVYTGAPPDPCGVWLHTKHCDHALVPRAACFDMASRMQQAMCTRTLHAHPDGATVVT